MSNFVALFFPGNRGFLLYLQAFIAILCVYKRFSMQGVVVMSTPPSRKEKSSLFVLAMALPFPVLFLLAGAGSAASPRAASLPLLVQRFSGRAQLPVPGARDPPAPEPRADPDRPAASLRAIRLPGAHEPRHAHAPQRDRRAHRAGAGRAGQPRRDGRVSFADRLVRKVPAEPGRRCAGHLPHRERRAGAAPGSVSALGV